MIPETANKTDQDKISSYLAERLANPKGTKMEALLNAGYAPSTARVPSVVENTQTYRHLAREAGMLARSHLLKIDEALSKRDFNELSTGDLLKHFDGMSRVVERFTPPQERPENLYLRTAFDTVINAEPPEELDQGEEGVTPSQQG